VKKAISLQRISGQPEEEEEEEEAGLFSLLADG